MENWKEGSIQWATLNLHIREETCRTCMHSRKGKDNAYRCGFIEKYKVQSHWKCDRWDARMPARHGNE